MNSHEMSKKKRKRRLFTDEYRAEVVRLCQQPGKTAHGVAKELGLTPSSVMGWVKQASTTRKHVVSSWTWRAYAGLRTNRV